jgi:hypothetical protein
MQYNHHIRNQHQQLSRATYILLKIILVKILPCIPPTAFFSAVFPCGPPMVKFCWQLFLVKHMLLASVFDADFEYDDYIA